jgi:hypothetical protein
VPGCFGDEAFMNMEKRDLQIGLAQLQTYIQLYFAVTSVGLAAVATFVALNIQLLMEIYPFAPLSSRTEKF